MIQRLEHFEDAFARAGFECVVPEFDQVVPVGQLSILTKSVDGWIVGDDEVSEASVGEANLSAIVKWGVGTDNIDFGFCEKAGIKVTNTPGMFNAEVSDLAIGYLIALCRDFVAIDREVRRGNWFKPTGISLAGKTLGILGLGI